MKKKMDVKMLDALIASCENRFYELGAWEKGICSGSFDKAVCAAMQSSRDLKEFVVSLESEK